VVDFFPAHPGLLPGEGPGNGDERNFFELFGEFKKRSIFVYFELL